MPSKNRRPSLTAHTNTIKRTTMNVPAYLTYQWESMRNTLLSIDQLGGVRDTDFTTVMNVINRQLRGRDIIPVKTGQLVKGTFPLAVGQ